MSSIKAGMGGSMGTLIGIAIALAVVSVVAGLTVLATGTSAGLVSAITNINSFLGIIGLGIVVALLSKVF